jgi:hypothetical protein
MDWNSLLNAAITGLFVGAGSTIGTYLVTKHFIRNLEALEQKIKEKAKTEN